MCLIVDSGTLSTNLSLNIYIVSLYSKITVSPVNELQAFVSTSFYD